MRVVAILNQKGGVGKTTTAVNLGAALARRGRKVLLIDMDPQCNLTDHLGIELDDETRTVYDVLASGTSLDEVIVRTATEGLDVAPADEDLAGVEVEMAGWPGASGLSNIGRSDTPWVKSGCGISARSHSVGKISRVSAMDRVAWPGSGMPG